MIVRVRCPTALLCLAALASNGCGPSPVETTYGRSRGQSINGTGVFAELLREQGHEVRPAVRLTDTLSEWADVVVRFSPHPGPPDVEEGRWLREWLEGGSDRRLVYVVRDFDAAPEFWDGAIAAQPKDAPADLLDQLKQRRDESKGWAIRLPSKPRKPASAEEWFAVDAKAGPPSTCKTLEGPWSEELDPRAAAIVKHEGFVVDQDDVPVLLRGDGSPLVVSWSLESGSRVLSLANASFLLNASLLNRARRPLAMRVVDWVGPGSGHVAFVEGANVLLKNDPGASPSNSPWHLLQVPPFGLVGAHILIFLLVLALAHAVTLGRPRPEPPPGVGRPSDHPEALGALLARTRRAETARALLETYRRWRHPSAAAGRATPSASPPSPSPHA